MTLKHLREMLNSLPQKDEEKELVVWLPNRELGNGMIFLTLHGEPELFNGRFFIEAGLSGDQK